MQEMTEDERKSLKWLRDENDVQRNVDERPDGSRKVLDEHDISGGQAALVQLLRDTSKPICPEIRLALAKAIDHFGDSVLQLKKRARRGAGRPKKDSIADDVRRAIDVLTIPAEIDSEAKKIRVPAAGEKPKKVPRKEIISRIGTQHDMSCTAVYETMKAANNMKTNKK